MRTKLLYLDDSYQKSMDAKIIDVDSPVAGLYRVVLDRTVFYPIGGGQATDQGTLESENWKAFVQEVVMKDGEVRHFIKSTVNPAIGEKVHGEIDWERRMKHMKIHSGGHIVDFAIHLLGLTPVPLMPLKGDHGKKSNILYQGSLHMDIQNDLQEKVNELVMKNLLFSWEFVSFEELKKDAIYLQSGLPTNKPLRKLTLAGVGSVADGGTQVKSTGEVGKIEILAVKSEGEMTQVDYRVI